MTTEEGNVAPSLHADAAAVRLFDLHDFCFKVAKAIGRGLSRRLLLEENLSVHGDSFVDDGVALQTLFHAQSAFFAADLVIARLEGNHQADLVANDALLWCLQLRLDVERRWRRLWKSFRHDLLLSTDVLRRRWKWRRLTCVPVRRIRRLDS